MGVISKIIRGAGKIFMAASKVIGVIFLGSMLIGILFSGSKVQEEKLPEKMILVLNLHDGLIEKNDPTDFISVFESFGETRLTTRQMIDAIDRGAKDARVAALVVDFESGDFGVSHVQELRAAIKRFRAAGKPAWAYSPSYAEAGGTMGAYYLAAAFDEIWMQPVGMVSLPGFDAEMPFFADALNKIGVEPQFFQRKEYKSIMENLARNEMSPENREMMTSLLSNIMAVLVKDIADDRKMASEEVQRIIDKGVLTDQESVAAKLVDHLDYPDVLLANLRKKVSVPAPVDGKKSNLINLAFYHGVNSDKQKIRTGEKHNQKPKIAIISAVGEIVSDKAGGFGNEVVTPEEMTAAFEDAIKNKDVKAIVFRVASPGGSPVASETIRRAVQNATTHNKPVIVSMGSMAGSGGYWIVTDATRIFALPSTLTGSIGVAGGRVAVAGLMEKLHIKWDGVQIGKNADMNSLNKPFSETGRERMNAIMDSIYVAFTDRVAKGRKLTPEAVEKIARGRVWTGQQALGIGLVDELGDLTVALDYTAKMIGVNNREDVDIVPLPRPKTDVEKILELMNIEVLMNKIGGIAMKTFSSTVKQSALPRVTAYDPFLERGL